MFVQDFCQYRKYLNVVKSSGGTPKHGKKVQRRK